MFKKPNPPTLVPSQVDIDRFARGAATRSTALAPEPRTKDLVCHVLVKFSPDEEAMIKAAFAQSTEKSQQKFLRNIILAAIRDIT